MLRLIEQHGDRPEEWVPHYEREAPRLAEDPNAIQQEPEKEPAFA
jgi:hypothetical protein